MGMQLIVYQSHAGSNPVRLAKVFVDVDKRLKSPVSQAGYRGFESRHRRQVHGDVR